jgi:hypothetical protein
VFDPTQEPLFLRQCVGRSPDPQVEENMRDKGQDAVRDPQSTILSMADQSVKKFLGLEVAQPLDTPLVIIVAKFDAWRHLLRGDLPPFSIPGDPVYGLRVSAVQAVSRAIEELMMEFTPDIVSAANRLSRHVTFIPVTATGGPPVVLNGERSAHEKPDYKFRVGEIRPNWVEVPLLWMLARHVPGLVPAERLPEGR